MKLREWDGLPQNAQDISRKFHNTYVKAIVPELDPKQEHVITIGDFDGGFCHVTYLVDEQGRSKRCAAEWGQIDVIEAWPTTVGSIPFFNKVLLLKRSIARQWQVGLCSHNSHVWNHTLRAITLRLQEANALFNPKYEFDKKDITKVVKRFEEQKTLEAVALDPIWWLVRMNDKLVLYRNQLPLGSFTFGRFFLNSKCSDFEQELWDDLKLKVKNGS